MLPLGKASRREFLAATTVAGAAALAGLGPAGAAEAPSRDARLSVLPKGPTPKAISLPHFPDRLHAFVWRNWELVPVERLALVLGARARDVAALARAMGLRNQPRITADQLRRSYITIIKRNWHLLPYEQLLALLGWNAEQLAYTLREDDFLYFKLGGLKPECAPVKYAPPQAEARARERQIAAIIKKGFGEWRSSEERLFAFVDELSRKSGRALKSNHSEQPRFCYSYFALYGDPLLDDSADPYPEGYLARLAAAGVNGVWLQAVLYKLAPFPWQAELSKSYEIRLKNLRKLVARGREHGIGIYLYLNEPRSMPLGFFADRPDRR